MGTKSVFSRKQCVLGRAQDSYLAVPSTISKWEEDASMWPHAGYGAGEEDDMGRVAP